MSIIRLIIDILFYIVMAISVGSVIFSWFPKTRWNAFGRICYPVTETPLKFFRRFLRPLSLDGGVGLDLSPLVFFLVAQILYLAVVVLLNMLGIK